MPRTKQSKWMGPYIGETFIGSTTPVFFDTHTQIASSMPPGIYISGQPGSGKTFFSSILAYQSVLSGKTTVYLDPKADAVNLLNLQSEIGSVNVWNLANDDEVEPGILDPFSLETDNSKQKMLVMSLIEAFVGKLSDEQQNSITPIIDDVSKESNPSLSRITQALLAKRNDPGANAIGNQLFLIKPQPFARLCFDHYNGDKRKIGRGLTIITLLGLEMPDPNTPSEDYDLKDRLSTGIMLLVTHYIYNIMIDSDKNKKKPDPKTIIIDESWAILATKAGQKIISQICRLGRSLNTACILISQNADDIDKFSIANSISTRFAFRVQNMGEAIAVRNAFDMPDDIGIESTIMEDFDKGDCLMKDYNGQISCVHIDGYDTHLTTAFNTNPFE